MNKKNIVYVIALLLALMFICVVAFKQETIQQDDNSNNEIENTKITDDMKDENISPILESVETQDVASSTENVKNTEDIEVLEPQENTVVETQNDFTEEVQENKQEENQQDSSGAYYMPQNSGFKSYMSYQAISTTSSPQYVLQNQYAYTGEYGIRQVDGRFCIAIGTFSNAKVGTYVDLVLQNGTVIPCIVGDFKSDIHTDSNNMVTLHNGCVSEFIVDKNSLHETAKKMGDVSYCREDWNSSVQQVTVYQTNVLEGSK